jgi:hypothetical protein
LDSTVARGAAGMTLVEVVMALAIVVLVFGTIIEGYVQSGKMTEWSGYSLAAQSVGAQVLEQAKSAAWDPAAGKCELTNFPLTAATLLTAGGAWINYSGYLTNILDVPWKGNNFVVVTNFVNFKLVTLAGNTNVQLIQVRVDTVWPFNAWGKFTPRVYTNTVCTYLAPDNPDAATLGR